MGPIPRARNFFFSVDVLLRCDYSDLRCNVVYLDCDSNASLTVVYLLLRDADRFALKRKKEVEIKSVLSLKF